MNLMKKLLFTLFTILITTSQAHAINPLDNFKENPNWLVANEASAIGKKIIVTQNQSEKNIIYNGNGWSQYNVLTHKTIFEDAVIDMDFLVTQDAIVKLYLQGHYELPLSNKLNEWQHLTIKYRAARFDAARNKTEHALMLEMRVNGELVQKNTLFKTLSTGAPVYWEEQTGNLMIVANQGQVALKNIDVRPADFSAVIPPTENGEKSNEKELVDYIALGKETFESNGCNVCHIIQPTSDSVSTGPNLYGLFTRIPRNRDIAEGGEKHKFTIKADTGYLHRSLRSPTEQLAIAETGAKTGEIYPSIMPTFSTQILSDVQIDAIGAYLATQNLPENQGPVIKLIPKAGQQAYNPLDDSLQLLVDKKTRIQRGAIVDPTGRSTSARAIHVGFANSISYSFDPLNFGIVKLWQGGFLDMSGEFLARGGKGLKLGYESREISLNENSLIAPLNQNGKSIDFSFKNAQIGDTQTIQHSLYNKQDHLARIAQENAQFLGYELDSKKPQTAPIFKYKVDENIIHLQTTIESNGTTQIRFQGTLKTAQDFSINNNVLLNTKTNTGKIESHKWHLPAGTKTATLTGKISLAKKTWHAAPSAFDNRHQAMRITPAQADMPAGYSIENYYPPKDNFGREQLFEALGLAVAEDGTIVVATRTAGIWRIKNGKWHLFAEGTFDSLGVVIEDKKGLQIVVGQKAELTRISDTNGDGLADIYQTLFDAHSFHGNYHAYMHGPVRGGDGAYYININLADVSDGSGYRANGEFMGSQGGFSGWSFRVQPDGSFDTFANGLRSPAGLGVDTHGQIWYSDNQGEYLGTSKLFMLKKDKFYGHPASLVDLPNMTPDSPEITWEKVQGKREQPVILFPQNKISNSPGNIVWDTTQGKFGAFAGQLFIGDQMQSNLMRVVTENVAGKNQGVLIPFAQGLESGVMRPLFLPDGSLLLGQTGRGWQAKGGKVASLQHMKWDGKTIAPALLNMNAEVDGFTLTFTQPLQNSISNDKLKKRIYVESWAYRDAPEYGSPELDTTQENITGITISENRKKVRLHFAQLSHANVHQQQTARVYFLSINTQENNSALFKDTTPTELQAYYTLYGFASDSLLE